MSIKSYFAECVLWRFVERDDEGRWTATERARAFLSVEIPVNSHVWPRDRELPAECVDSEPVYVYEVTPHDFWDKAEHAEHSVALR